MPTSHHSNIAPLALEASTDAVYRMMLLHSEALQCDPEVQQRLGLSEEYISAYAELLQEGHQLGRIVVFQDGSTYYLTDGFHRVEAARRIGLEELPAEIRVGTKREAVLYAAGANRHGKHLTPEEKRRTVARLVQDPEWGQWSDNAIAKHCGVAQSFVSKVRRSLHSEISEKRPRTYTTRHGTVTTMDTTRIGRTSPVASPTIEQSPVTAATLPPVPTPTAPSLAVPIITRDPGGGLNTPPDAPPQALPLHDTLARLLEEARTSLQRLQAYLGTLQETQNSQECLTADGRPLASLQAFITEAPPVGLGCDVRELATLVAALHIALNVQPATPDVEPLLESAGPAPQVKQSHKQRLLELLPDLPEPFAVPPVAAQLGLTPKATRKVVQGLLKEGEVVRVQRGLYAKVQRRPSTARTGGRSA